MVHEYLSSKNFQIFAARHYDNPACLTDEEFLDDLRRFKYIKRLFNKYLDGGDLNERLILNHIVVIYNLFGVEASSKMLFLKLAGFECQLKTFLHFLSLCPTQVVINDREIVNTEAIPLDPLIFDRLKAL